MPNPIVDDDVWKKIHKIYSDKYSDYVFHMLKFRSEVDAYAFASQLSFISGLSLQSLSAPPNIQPLVMDLPSEKVVLIGGQLTGDQNYEVRQLAHKLGLKCESMCAAKPGTLTQQAFMQATLRPDDERPAGKKKWWQVF